MNFLKDLLKTVVFCRVQPVWHYARPSSWSELLVKLKYSMDFVFTVFRELGERVVCYPDCGMSGDTERPDLSILGTAISWVFTEW